MAKSLEKYLARMGTRVALTVSLLEAAEDELAETPIIPCNEGVSIAVELIGEALGHLHAMIEAQVPADEE